jgi:hypothetical protein
MKTTKMLVSPSTPGRFTTSGMQATAQPHKSKTPPMIGSRQQEGSEADRHLP